MSEAGLHSDEDAKWLEDALLACHANGTLPSRAFLKKCGTVAKGAVRRRQILSRLYEALPRVQCSGGAIDQIQDLLFFAGVTVRDGEFVLSLPKGFLAKRDKRRTRESAIVARPLVATRMSVVPDAVSVDASSPGLAYRRIHEWLVQLVNCADDPHTRAGIQKGAQKFAKLIGEAS